MQDLVIDAGVQEFTVNGRGCLRFNPGDPNLYHRFFTAREPLAAMDTELNTALQALQGVQGLAEEERSARALAMLADYDARIKALLGEIFGPENDFNAVLEGVNLAAPAANGQRVVQNLLAALAPVLEQGARRTVEETAAAAVEQAQQERARRAGAGAAP